MIHKKTKTKNSITNNKTKTKKCYKKYCNNIITKKELNKLLIKQFNNSKKNKNIIAKKRKLTKLIIKSDKCMNNYCKKINNPTGII
jgi:hypothetical protein